MIKPDIRNVTTCGLLLLLIVSSLLVSCATIQRAFLLDDIAHTPAKKVRSYSFNAASTLISRVQPAPGVVLNYLTALDQAPDYSPYTPTREEMRMIETYLANLPRHIRTVLQARLLGIYFINNFRGAGLTEYVLHENNDVYIFLAFNPDTLKMDLSYWLTYRENSCFIWGSSGEQLEIAAGTEYTGFLYALVHESAHAIDYVEGYTPYPEKSIAIINKKKGSTTPFVASIWEDLHTPLKQYDFFARARITFYWSGEPQIAIADAGRMYEELARTPFVSLYGSTTWAEDFADFVMFYHLTQKLGQPYEIHFTNKTGALTVYRPLEGEKVKQRFPFVKNLYE